jgi:CRP/FNR family cyclic AMP-dependent transcriptional regulator
LPEPLVELPAGLSAEMTAALEILANNPAFAKVPSQHIASLGQHGRKRLFMAGSVLMVEGARSDNLYFLVKGKVAVETRLGTPKRKLVAELGPGEFVGEMGTLLQRPRSATVTARDDVETLELNPREIKQIFRDDHEMMLGFVRIIRQRQQAIRS